MLRIDRNGLRGADWNHLHEAREVLRRLESGPSEPLEPESNRARSRSTAAFSHISTCDLLGTSRSETISVGFEAIIRANDKIPGDRRGGLFRLELA